MTQSVIIFFIMLSCGCVSNSDVSKFISPPGYDLSNPLVIHLKNDQDEISGLSYYARDSSIFTIADETGILYKVHLKKPIKLDYWKFSGAGDFEDILLVDTTFYVLQSNGDLKAFSFVKGKVLFVDECRLPLNGNNEFEAIYYDNYSNRIVMLCKDCEEDKHRAITAFSFNISEQAFSKKPYYQLDGQKINRLLGSDYLKFKPSAAAIHPLTKELYIVSAVANALVIADTEGNIKSAYRLNPHFFKQPEGLTFSPEGTLYISNEAAGQGSGNILIFKYKQLADEKK